MGTLVKLLQEPRAEQKKQRVPLRAQEAGQLLFFTGVRYSRIDESEHTSVEDEQELKSGNSSTILEQRERLSKAIFD